VRPTDTQIQNYSSFALFKLYIQLLLLTHKCYTHISTPASHTLSMEKELEPRNVQKVCGTRTINKFVKTMYNHFPI